MLRYFLDLSHYVFLGLFLGFYSADPEAVTAGDEMISRLIHRSKNNEHVLNFQLTQIYCFSVLYPTIK